MGAPWYFNSYYLLTGVLSASLLAVLGVARLRPALTRGYWGMLGGDRTLSGAAGKCCSDRSGQRRSADTRAYSSRGGLRDNATIGGTNRASHSRPSNRRVPHCACVRGHYRSRHRRRRGVLACIPYPLLPTAGMVVQR